MAIGGSRGVAPGQQKRGLTLLDGARQIERSDPFRPEISHLAMSLDITRALTGCIGGCFTTIFAGEKKARLISPCVRCQTVADRHKRQTVVNLG